MNEQGAFAECVTRLFSSMEAGYYQGMAHSGAVLLNAFPLKMLRLACVTFALNLQRTPNDQ